MRAARLISLVLLLQARSRMTAGELAAELEVSERTVYRDVLALNAAGIPVYADRGASGGYRLLGGYQTRLTGLDSVEAQALFLSGLGRTLDELGLGDQAGSARRKVSAALPAALRDAADDAARRFHLDAPRWFDESTAPPLLGELAKAVWQDQLVVGGYLRSDRQVERELAPLALVLKNGVWYLVARVAADHRVYRVDRFVRVEPLPTRFVRDDSFDLGEFWRNRSAEFVRQMLTIPVTLRITAAGARSLPKVMDPTASKKALAEAGEPDEHGLRTVTVPVESIEIGIDILYGLGPEAEVLDPPEIRAGLAEAAERLSRLYRS
ncbi:helix-turn-helix transcriptional regulator [Actinoalloteichus hymeniacidonis]|uniref:Transcriptional regulator n=1 Tax=Actinoalloteichus hymeniacidonis TaxID=340345 RepID=A0AAC9MZK7_9PSEU|nr:WYL domain-containing protein [Actinoalloteichus hymeniacidonis]AOS64470.1 putative transcriptional regulator [Actinoalloteichus hymeniacidonis]MBB5907460.1 putative DNA-binding transcriptional regulator YafY [Actinoalloteichus hymeniacidonis]